MSRKARAAVLEALGQPLAIREVAVPDLLPGQILVKVYYSGVCRSQLMESRGMRGEDKWLPHLLGHEGSGEVVAVGTGVTKVGVGDEVILGWIKGTGLDAPGAKYECNGKTINSGRVTTFSNFTVVSESRVVKKPPDLARDTAVLFGCALLTGAGMVFNELKPQKDSSVVVLGLGGIGLSALIALREFGCREVIAVDISEDKLSLATKFGATHTVNSAIADVVEEVRQITRGGADMCIESAGTTATIEQGFQMIRTAGGKLLFASHPPDGCAIKIMPFDLISGKQIAGSWGGGSIPDRDVPRISQALRDGDIPIGHLLTKRYTLEKINEALDDLEAGNVFRPIVVMEH